MFSVFLFFLLSFAQPSFASAVVPGIDAFSQDQVLIAQASTASGGKNAYEDQDDEENTPEARAIRAAALKKARALKKTASLKKASQAKAAKKKTEAEEKARAEQAARAKQDAEAKEKAEAEERVKAEENAKAGEKPEETAVETPALKDGSAGNAREQEIEAEVQRRLAEERKKLRDREEAGSDQKEPAREKKKIVRKRFGIRLEASPLAPSENAYIIEGAIKEAFGSAGYTNYRPQSSLDEGINSFGLTLFLGGFTVGGSWLKNTCSWHFEPMMQTREDSVQYEVWMLAFGYEWQPMRRLLEAAPVEVYIPTVLEFVHTRLELDQPPIPGTYKPDFPLPHVSTGLGFRLYLLTNLAIDASVRWHLFIPAMGKAQNLDSGYRTLMLEDRPVRGAADGLEGRLGLKLGLF